MTCTFWQNNLQSPCRLRRRLLNDRKLKARLDQAETKNALEQDLSQRRWNAKAQAKAQACIYYVPTRPKHQVVIEDTAIDTAGSGACRSLFATPMYILDKFAHGLRGQGARTGSLKAFNLFSSGLAPQDSTMYRGARP